MAECISWKKRIWNGVFKKSGHKVKLKVERTFAIQAVPGLQTTDFQMTPTYELWKTTGSER